MRAVAGIVVGLIASLIAAVIVGIFALGATFSPPAGADASNMREVATIFINLPMKAQLALGVAWFASGFGGAFVGKLIARRAWVAWAVALIVAAYFGLVAFSLLMPLWIQAVWVIGPLLGGLIGNALVRSGAALEAVVAEAGDAPADI